MPEAMQAGEDHRFPGVGIEPDFHPRDTLYRLLVETVRDYAIFALDTNGYILTWNAGAERLKGYTRDEIVGRHFSIFYPPEAVAAGRTGELLAKALEDGRVEDEGWRVRKDGTRFWADVVITALREPDGTHIGFAKVTRDLTERRAAENEVRASEERFRLLVDSVQEYGIFGLDALGRVTSWNEGAQRINGYTADEIIGRHFSVFYPSEDVARGKPAWELKEAIANGRFEDEDWRIRKDGTMFWANVVITPLRDPTGELIGFAKVTRDLTERKAAQERAIADARRVAEAEASSRAKSEFLAAMSHELRTPLNAIGGYADLLLAGVRGPLGDTQRQDLERIRASQQHLLGIITDLLNFSRIEAGRISYHIGSVRLADAVSAVLPMVEPQAANRDVTVDASGCEDSAVVALGDRAKVEQILLNLLTNAAKFTPAGGRITVSCSADAERAYLDVGDTGLGIPPEKLEAIFEPFVQLNRTLTNTQEGTGLGLAISRDMARAMDGDLTAESEVGKGSRFRLALPVPGAANSVFRKRERRFGNST